MRWNNPDPTEAEIADKCREIRATWSKAETEKRSQYPTRRVEIEVIDARDLFGESDSNE